MNRIFADERFYPLAVLLISAGLLGGAYTFQYVWHYLPCELCYWQRKPHMALIPLGLAALLWREGRPYLLGLMGLVALGSAGLGLFHTGVEQHWWKGLSGCSAPTVNTTNLEEARRLILGHTVVPCDRSVWDFLGLSMASWNGVFSLVQAGLALTGVRVAWRAR